MVLLQDGSLHAMGEKHRCGQASSSSDYYSPVPVQIEKYAKIASIACCSYACTIVKTVRNEWFGFGDPNSQEQYAYGKPVTCTATRIDDVFPSNVVIKQLLASKHAFFMRCANGDLYSVGAIGQNEIGQFHKRTDKWVCILQTTVAFIQIGMQNSFIFKKTLTK